MAKRFRTRHTPRVAPTTALDAANALVRALQTRFGVIEVSIHDGAVMSVRATDVLKPDDLDGLTPPEGGDSVG